MLPRLTCLTASLLLALPALAATPINQTRPLAADGSLRIENIKGEVVVRTWDRPEVHVTGSLGEGVEKLEIGPGGDSLSIKVKYPNSGGGWFGSGNRSEPSRIEVRMPAGASLDRTEAVMQRASKIIQDTGGVDGTVAFAGLDGASFSFGSNAATIFVRLSPFEDRTKEEAAAALAGAITQATGQIEDAQSCQ